MPMNSAHLETTSPQNARVVPVEPNVKSAGTRELFNAGMSAAAQIGKSADPSCYDSSRSKKGPGCLTLWR